MSFDLSMVVAHPEGESISSATSTPAPALVLPEAVAVDTPGGRVHVEWDPQAPLTPMGQLVFFTQFLKTAELYEPWVTECPLRYTSLHIPTVVGHPFRFISDSHSNSKRTPVPIDIGQSFRFDIGHFFGESERCPISSEGCPTCLGTVSDMVGTH